MSGRSVASTVILVCVCLSVSSVCQADVASSISDSSSVDAPILPESQIRLLTIKTIVSTLVSTVSYTVMVYPTCTTAAPGVSACAVGDPLPAHLTTAPPTVPVPATPTPHVPGVDQAASTMANVMEVVLPSCDCGKSTTGSRTPRFLSSEDVITIQTTTTLTEDKLLTATAPTTVSITYNGCVPTDAVSTTPCLVPTTTTATATTATATTTPAATS